FGAESGENHAVDDAELGAGEHGDGKLGYHGHVDADPIPLLQAEALEAVCELIDLLIEVAVGDLLDWLVCRLWYPYVCNFVLLCALGVPVHGVVCDVDLTSSEPVEV